MSQSAKSGLSSTVPETPLTDALLDQFAAYYLLCALAIEMLEEARRQRAIAEQLAGSLR